MHSLKFRFAVFFLPLLVLGFAAGSGLAAPVFTSSASAFLSEGALAGAKAYTATATESGQTITYSLSGPDASAFTINSATGVVTINAVPDYETQSSYSITVGAADQIGGSSTLGVTINILDLAPTLTSGTTASVPEGTSTATAVYTVVATDPGGGTVTYALGGTNASAFTINSTTGVVKFNAVPDFETKSSYSIAVRAADPSGQFSSQSVTISITDVAPAITSASTVAVNEGVAAGTTVYTAVAADPAGGTVTYALTGPDAAAFSINAATGVVTINAVPDYETKSLYSINVKAADPSGLFSTLSVSVNITDLPPVITSGATASAVEGTSTATSVYTAVATDPGGGTVTYALGGTDASAFTINSLTGVVKFTAVPDFETKSSYSINVKASDPSGVFSTLSVSVNITDLPPVITSGATASVPEGTSTATAVYTAVATDPGGGTVTYALGGTDASAFTIDNLTGVVKFNAVPDYETKSSYSITVSAADPSGQFSTKLVTISITDLPPVISSGTSASVVEGVAAGTPVYTASAADPAGGSVTYSLTGTDAVAFSINSLSGVVTINAVPDYETKTSYSINVKASDPSGAFNTQAVGISVTDVAPTITSPPFANVNEGVAAGTTVYTVTAADPGGGTVTYSLTGTDAAAFSINSATGVVKFNFSPDYETKSVYSINVKASDPSGLFNTQAVAIFINDLPPVISSSMSASVAEGVAAGTVVYTAVAADPAGGVVIYALAGPDAAAFTINSLTGVVTVNAVPDYETKNNYVLTIVVEDANNQFNTQIVSINVTDLPPVITSGTTVSVPEGTSTATVIYTAIAADPGGGTVTYSFLPGGDASAFTINSLTGVVKFNAAPDFETKSLYSIAIRAADQSGLNNLQAVTINVTNLPPVISSGSTASVLEGVAAGSTAYTAIAADPGGGTVTYTLSGPDAAAFTINSATGVVTINAVPDFETKTSYSVTVKASDPGGLFNSQAVAISITDLPPVISSGTSASVVEGVAAGTAVYTATAADPAGGAVTYSLTGGDTAAFTINSATGVVTINAVPDFETKSVYVVGLKASDPSGAFNIQAVAILITDLPPVITSGATASVVEGVAAGTAVYTATAADPVGGTVTYALTGTDAAAFTINSATGVLTINAVPHYATKSAYSFNVKASDPGGAFNILAMTVTVTPIASIPPNLTGANFSSSGGFGFQFTSVAGASFTVLTSTNLTVPSSNWTVLGAITDSPAGHYQFSDPQATNNLRRFYRVHSP